MYQSTQKYSTIDRPTCSYDTAAGMLIARLGAAVEMIIKLELLHAVALLVFFTLACWPHWPCL